MEPDKIRQLLTGTADMLSADSLEPWVGDHMRRLVAVERPPEELRAGIHRLLDVIVHGALAAEFVVMTLDMAWRSLGGRASDPAPWRDNPTIPWWT